MNAKRIWILGGTASGKTTLAKKISKKLKIPFYSTDDFIYKKKWSEKYSDDVQIRKLDRVVRGASWIIEGVHKNEWVNSSIKKADLIIFLDMKKFRLLSRVVKRQRSRKKDNEPGSGFSDLMKLLWWVFTHMPKDYKKYKNEKPDFVILKNPRQVNNFLEDLK